MKFSVVLLLPLLVLISGCIPYRYHAAPLSPPTLASALYQRSLDDPELRSWMQQKAGFGVTVWPLESWDLNSLTLAAYYFNPDLDLARANTAAADAAVTTAAMKPNPSVGIGPGYESPPESQFIMGFNFDLPIETAGKRGYRVAVARHTSEASRLQLAQTAWTVGSRVRAALADYLFAQKTAAALRQQETLQAEYPALIERQVRAGEMAQPESATAEIELTRLRQALVVAEGQVGTTRAMLAAMIGVPDAALDRKRLIWSGIEGLPPPGSLSVLVLRESAVANRLDVLRALEQYESSQSNLQLEIARQYPDIHLGPGYNYEEGAHFITLSLSAVLPIRNHNEGPIAEAEAQRKAAGAQLLSAQAAVIADSDKALAQYISAYKSLEHASRAELEIEQQQQTAEHLLRSGETDQLSVVGAHLQSLIAQRARLDAEHQAQLALGALEDALQRPLEPAANPALPTSAPRQQGRFQ
jgi:outer membrane protein TolC